MKLKYTITLILGDYSHDGHSKTSEEYIKSNLTVKQIEKAYETGVKKIGVNLINDVATGYEENYISFSNMEKFVNAGFDINKNCNKDDLKSYKNKENIEYIGELYTDLYLFTIYIGNNNFEYKIIDDYSTRINIGGYGLFD